MQLTSDHDDNNLNVEDKPGSLAALNSTEVMTGHQNYSKGCKRHQKGHLVGHK